MALKKDIKVISFDSNNTVVFGTGDKIGTIVEGIDLITQKIVIKMFTETNSNFFTPSEGSNLYSIIAGNYNPNDLDFLRTNLINVFSSIEEKIKEEQEEQEDQGVSLASSEKLLTLKLRKVEYDLNNFTWNIEVKVLTEGGNTLIFNIG